MTDGTSKQEDELSPGDVCDGYRIVALIAAGGMGDVYEAVHDPSGRIVAVKCLKVRHRNKEDARARMKMEAVVLSELQHENLVQVYDAGVTDAGMVWIAMERLHGQTLRDLLYRAGQLSVADALYYASEIADGVDAVHEVNVIHRDLKPENIFITDRQVVKVLDLGTGKFTGYGLNSTDRMRVVGTTAYMSPEQIKGLRVDARADVYALGLIVYEMIAGRHPLALEDGLAGLPQAIEQVALMQLQMTPKPLADVAGDCPRYVSAIVDKAITKDRDRRHPTMTAFARELRATRKRFVAENQLDSVGPALDGEGLREKFGAPPRTTSDQARRVMPVARGAVATPALTGQRAPSTAPRPDDTAADPRADDFPTEIRPPLNLPLDGSTLVPAYVPTLALSSASLSTVHSGTAPSNIAPRVAMPDDVRNRPTNTNPLGLVQAVELSPTELSAAGIRRSSRLAVWGHPVVRRAVITLGLGALIGVPPAVIGVLWSAHRRANASFVAPAGPSGPLLPRDEVPVRPTESPAASEEGLPGIESGRRAVGNAPSVPAGEPLVPSVASGQPQASTTPGATIGSPAVARTPRRPKPAMPSPVGAKAPTPLPVGAKAPTPSPVERVSTSNAVPKAPGEEPSSKTILPPSGL